jgi:hypothetical protein
VTFDPDIPFRSVSPERIKILDWYLQGCISKQRCVVWGHFRGLTFALKSASTLSPEQMQILDWFAGMMYLGTKVWWNHGDVTLHGNLRVLQPVTFALHTCTSTCQFSLLHPVQGCFPAFVLTNTLHLVLQDIFVRG